MITPSPRRIDQVEGGLLGLAIGDALGASVEFQRPGTFAPLTDLRGGGPWNLEVGQWTDDTSMALCLAESLSETGGFDPIDQLQKYVAWWRKGRWSCKGYCFDIGNTTWAALYDFQQTNQPYCGSTNPRSAGNGSLMRLAPVPLFYADHPELAIERSGDSSRTTHAAPEAVDGCRYYAALIVGALHGDSKDQLLSPFYLPPTVQEPLWDKLPLSPKIAEIASGSFKVRQPPEIRGTGYVVDCLEAALWAFYHTDSYQQCVLDAANLGDDADTTAAVAGQIAGAYYGRSQIPNSWIDRIAMRDEILGLAHGLLKGPSKNSENSPS